MHEKNDAEGHTTIRVVFAKYNNIFQAHEVEINAKNDIEQKKLEEAGLKNITRWVFEDFQSAVMAFVGYAGVTGACVRFDSYENSEYYPQEEQPQTQTSSLAPLELEAA